MQALNTRVTKLVTLIIWILLAAPPALATSRTVARKTPAPAPAPAPASAPAPAPAPDPFLLTFKEQIQQTANPGSYPYEFAAVGLEYTFYKSVALGLDAGFLRELRKVSDHTGDYFADPVVSLSDKELWLNKDYELTLKGSLALLLPVSTPSRLAGMIGGGGGSLSLKQQLTPRFALTYVGGATTYTYYYDTAYEDPTVTVYNTHYMAVTRLLATFDATPALHLSTQVSMLTYNNLENNTYYAYIASGGMSYDMAPWASLDLGVRSGYKDHESPITWNGPTTSDRPFNGEGVTLYFGFTLKF